MTDHVLGILASHLLVLTSLFIIKSFVERKNMKIYYGLEDRLRVEVEFFTTWQLNEITFSSASGIQKLGFILKSILVVRSYECLFRSRVYHIHVSLLPDVCILLQSKAPTGISTHICFQQEDGLLSQLEKWRCTAQSYAHIFCCNPGI